MATVLLQARMGSSRLPGKVMKPILGKPMLYYTVETLKKSTVIERIVLATSGKKTDDVLVDFARDNGIDIFRGSEDNVLERFYLAAKQYPDDYYFRSTGDNPIIDYQNPLRMLTYLKEGGYDYICERGMPVGAVLETFTSEALERCFNEAETADDREHVTLYMKNSGRYKAGFNEAPGAFRFPELRLTVDYPEDFQRATEIIEAIYAEGIPPFKKVIDFATQKGWL